MGIAAFVLGVLSSMVSVLPYCNYFIIPTALTGLTLGIIDIVRKVDKGEKLGLAISGVVLSGFALLLVLILTFVVTIPVSNAVNKAVVELTNFNIPQDLLTNIIK